MITDPAFCQNCGRLCKEVHKGSNGLPYCSRDCAIIDSLIVEYEWVIFLTIMLLIPAMTITSLYMADKYSPTTQTQEQENDERGTR